MTWTERKELIKSTFLEFFKERSLMHGAALSYYSMLALVPMLYLSITYVGMLVGNEVIIDIIARMLQEWVGVQDASGIVGFLDEVDFQGGSTFLQVAGILALLFSCSAIFNSLRRSLNSFYDIDDYKLGRKKAILRNVFARLVSLGFVIGGTLLIVVLYFAQSLFLSFSMDLLKDMELLSSAFASAINHGLPILTNLIVFFFIFKYMHDGKVGSRIALRGALVTSVLLYLGQVLIKFYLTNYFFAASGGVAGSMLIILVWVYYSSQIIFFGAKYIAVLSRMRGTPVVHRD
jgi:membrane protein